MPGDRLDAELKTFGAMAGKAFDQLVIREDTNRRGRADGAIAEMLRESAMDAGMSIDKISIVLEEMGAVRTAIDRSHKDDFVILMVDKPVAVWQMLEKM